MGLEEVRSSGVLKLNGRIMTSSSHPCIASSSALRTSKLPGMTRTTSTRLRLCDQPPIYSVDSPGVMVPFLGYGREAREKGVKIGLIRELPSGLYWPFTRRVPY